MKLALAETFCSIQGEGHLTGKRMFFIRFAGCAVKECPLHPSQGNLCDTDWSVSTVLTGEQSIDALTVSPKVPATDLKQSYGQELKLVVTGQSEDEVLAYYQKTRFWNYYLQPLWSNGNCNSDQTMSLVDKLNNCGQPWELSPQVHKYLGIR